MKKKPKKWVVPMVCSKCGKKGISGGWFPSDIKDCVWVRSSCCEEHYELYKGF